MTIKDLEKIINDEITAGFNRLIDTLGENSRQMLQQSAFERNEMQNLSGDMSLPQSVFRKFLQKILPLTPDNTGKEGDLVCLTKDEDGNLFHTYASSFTFFRGLNVSQKFDSLNDISNVSDTSLDGKIVFISGEDAFYYARMDSSVEDVLEFIDTDDFVCGEYTLRKIISLEDVPNDWVIRLNGRYYDDDNGKLVACYTNEELKTEIESLKERILLLENKNNE